MKIKILSLCLLLFAISCGDKEEPNPKGSIFVTVMSNSIAVSDAKITTEPVTESETTDITGTAIITDVPIGGYKINASHPNIGSGSSSVTVTEDAVMNVTVNLITNAFTNPTVNITSPTNLSNHGLDVDINFSAEVNDDEDEANTLGLEWSSNIDGVFNTEDANADGIVNFSINSLTEGEHTITLTAKDSDDFSSTDQISISITKSPPTVDITSPADFSTHDLGDIISFFAIVDDLEDASNELDIEWSSNIDGVINTEDANLNGSSLFMFSALSTGQHIITLEVTDSDKLKSSDQITIDVVDTPDPVTLNPIETMTGGLKLNWTISTEAEFANYRILRSQNNTGPFDIIDIISDINTNNFSDTNISFGVRYFYQIGVVLNNGEEVLSNIESELFEGENIDLGVNIVRMILDPSRPYIYALDQLNNSLLFINKESKVVEKTIFVGSSPTDIDISIDNSKAFIANFGSTQLAVIDLVNQEKVDEIFVDTQGGWDGNPHRISCLSNNRLVFTSEDQWCDLKLVNAETGASLYNTGSIYQPGLLSNSTGDIIYATESGSSGSATLRFNLSGNELIEVDESDGGSSFGFRDGCISGNDEFIFHRRIKYFSNNLSSVLGSFNENIIDCNFDGSIAIGEENIWDAEEFAIIKPLPISSSILRLDHDENTIYIYDNNSSKIYITSIE